MSVSVGNKAIHVPKSQKIGTDIFYRNIYGTHFRYFFNCISVEKTNFTSSVCILQEIQIVVFTFASLSFSEFNYVTLCFLCSWHILKVRFKAFEFLSQNSFPKLG